MRVEEVFPPSVILGCCYLCGDSGKGEPVIVTDRDIDYEGTLAICATCVAEMAALLGFDEIAKALTPPGPPRLSKAQVGVHRFAHEGIEVP